MKNTIFITGAASGIGKAAAVLFAENGWLVCATDVNPKNLADLKLKLGPEHYYYEVNVTDHKSINNALSEFAERAGGSIDVLLNNAGIAFIENFEDLALEKHIAVTKVNVEGVLNTTYLAKPYLDRSDKACVINMCSASANYGVPSEASYSASKFWVRGFTEALNIEWENKGIHVCAVLPNFVATPMMDACDGDIVQNVGIKLTVADVAKNIWDAAHDRKRVHWHVDTWKYHFTRLISKFLPQPVMRMTMKKMAGY